MGNFDLETQVKRDDIGNLEYELEPESLRAAHLPTFSSAEMNFKTAPAIVDSVVKVAKSGIFGFTLSDEHYRQAVAWWMKTQRKHPIDQEWIVPTLGTIFSVATCIRMTLKNKDDCLIVQPPVYERYKQAADRLERKTVFNPLKHNLDGTYSIDFTDLAEKMKDPHNKLLILCNPHNPLGKVWSKEDLEKIADLAIKHQVVVFSDEIFADYTFDQHDVYPYFLINDGKNNGISAIGLGKTFNFTGVNHAIMLIKDPKLRQQFTEQRTQDHYGSLDPLVRAAVLGAYTPAGAAWKDAVSALIISNYQQLKEVFELILPEVKLTPLEGGYITWADWRAWKMSDTNLLKFLTDQALFLPESGRNFNLNQDGFMRINLAISKSVMTKALVKLQKAIKELRQREVRITLKPFDHARQLEFIAEFKAVKYQVGDLFDTLPESVATCPSAQYDHDTLKFLSNGHNVAYHFERVQGSNGVERRYIFDQAVIGNLQVIGKLTSRARDLFHGDPGMNFLQHDTGTTVAALMFILLPATDWAWYHLHYDLRRLSAEASAICGWSATDFSRYCSSAALKNLFFAFGKLDILYGKSHKLRIVTLDHDIKFIDQLKQQITKLFNFMENFFNDAAEPFVMIVYPTPRAQATGTGYCRTNYFGFGDKLVNSAADVDDTLAHELVHNWLVFNGDSNEDVYGLIYDEGAADYYAGLMCQRVFGKKDTWITSLNDKLRAYYSNPLSAEDCLKNFAAGWTQTYALRAVYGRGVLLMLQLNAQIKQATHQAKSLDDVQVEIASKISRGQTVTFALFKQAVVQLGGQKAAEIINKALGAGLMFPPQDLFAPAYQLVEGKVPQEEQGFDLTVRFETPSIIHGLVPGSNAQKAGLQNGDEIIKYDSDWNTMEDPEMLTNVTVDRQGRQVALSYLARGSKTVCWQYQKNKI
ncbi:aminotransferase class I/II-fold pyridoxal phosphate-dependent enzyme [Liquorilactobacillus vini]|uniref:cysteine-S-conjugate beta-lyase n=1 Tax=Liquorilactobacillus vini DSM 20605 TaxID=1133569 RepID=A0A0R2CEK3_9LACO|nr:aminotransferase class I/II-fold pyridoxal phosphate-dependent enzyme [Liquorilactobacillus vini]KRM86406.1 aminotransferase B [Liquorilactobacillus vini DSM 20605]